MKQVQNTPPGKENSEMPFGTKNYVLLLIGLLAIIIGFWIMSKYKFSDATTSPPDLTIAPLIIVAGYAFIVYGIMAKSGKS